MINNNKIKDNIYMDINYKNKYNKYKNKYLQLKLSLNQYGGKNLISKNIISNILENIISTSYSIFELDYSNENKKTIEDIKINKNLCYNFYGSIDNFIFNTDNSTELSNYIVEIGDNNINTSTDFVDIIKNLAKVLSLGYNKDFFWLTIRTVLPSDHWIIPRWHCDGNYFDTEKYTLLFYCMFLYNFISFCIILYIFVSFTQLYGIGRLASLAFTPGFEHILFK